MAKGTTKRKKGKGRGRRLVKGHTRTLPSGKKIKIAPYYRQKRKDIRKKRTVKKPKRSKKK